MNQIIRLDLNGVNAYLIPVENNFILVDTGGYTFRDKPLNNRCEILNTRLKENGCIPGKLKLLILTHGDIDHVANTKYIKDNYGAKTVIHKEDEDLIYNLNAKKILHNFKFEKIGMKVFSMLLKSLFIKMSNKIVNNYTEFEADEYIDSNFNLYKYGMDAKIIHIPGHTKGSIGILFSNGDFISGDVLANMDKHRYAINAYDFKSLKKSLYSLKDKKIKMVYPGHGEPFNFSELKL